MINNWLVWSLWLFDDWFMKSQSISPLRKWLSSLVVLSWVWKVYGVFSFEIRFWQHFKRYSNCNNNNACTQTVLKGAKKLSFTVWPIWAGCSLHLLAQESQLFLLCFTSSCTWKPPKNHLSLKQDKKYNPPAPYLILIV